MASASADEPKPSSSRPEAPLRVLIVEDNVSDAESLAIVLGMYGLRVDVAGTAAAAVSAVHANLPDVVLMDIGLPDGDGYQLARQLRLLLGQKPLLIALTGNGQESDHHRSADEGFVHHLVKPVDPCDVVRLFEEYGRSRRTLP